MTSLSLDHICKKSSLQITAHPEVLGVGTPVDLSVGDTEFLLGPRGVLFMKSHSVRATASSLTARNISNGSF